MRYLINILLIAAFVMLSGCESASERAQEHYESGLSLYQEGDYERAIVEMRNVLELDPNHKEGRRLYADMLREQGDLKQAAAQYLDLTERYPEDGEAHLAVAELAMTFGDWNRVRTHGDAAVEYLPDSGRVRVIRANLAYRDALENENSEAADAAVADARKLIEADPSLIEARRIVIDDLVRKENWDEALAVIDGGLEQDPDRLDLHQMKLPILNELGRTQEVTAQLEEMSKRFPDINQVSDTLARWYVANDQMDEAEAFLRQRADAAPEDIDRWTKLLAFLAQVRGSEAVNQELDRLIAAGGDNIITLKAMKATQDFQSGERDKAIAEQEDLLAGLSDEDKAKPVANDVRVNLARMHAQTGNNVRARELIDEALQRDPKHVGALKILASWQIADDQVNDAIVTLRSAMREAPRDADLMTLMAAAHERAGEPELQREMLALAAQTSGNAPEESLRYAANLIQNDRVRRAEEVLIEALRLSPDNVRLLEMLGRVHLSMADFGRAEQDADALAKHGQAAAAASLRAQILAAQQRDDDLIAYLETLSGEEGNVGAEVALIRQFASSGQMDAARERLDAALEKSPDNPVLKFIDAAMKASTGDYQGAETGFEALLAETPTAQRVWMSLFRLKMVQGDAEGARKVLDRALEALPNDVQLRINLASALEREGDVDGAIAIYEQIYAQNSGIEVVANNLASLLSTYREDQATLERSYQIARRLQDSKVPAFRETYGWIAARLGRYEEAVEHLSIAAEAYPDLALAQYHYAVALAGLNRNAEALEVFRHVQTLDQSSLPESDRERIAAEIARLETSQSE